MGPEGFLQQTGRSPGRLLLSHNEQSFSPSKCTFPGTRPERETTPGPTAGRRRGRPGAVGGWDPRRTERTSGGNRGSGRPALKPGPAPGQSWARRLGDGPSGGFSAESGKSGLVAVQTPSCSPGLRRFQRHEEPWPPPIRVGPTVAETWAVQFTA